MLRLEKVTAGYGATRVIEDISFELPEHGLAGVLGRNASARPRFLATIMAIPPQSGSIQLAGTEIGSQPIERRSLPASANVPQEREIFSVPDGRGEPDRRLAAGSWDLARDLRPLS